MCSVFEVEADKILRRRIGQTKAVGGINYSFTGCVQSHMRDNRKEAHIGFGRALSRRKEKKRQTPLPEERAGEG